MKIKEICKNLMSDSSFEAQVGRGCCCENISLKNILVSAVEEKESDDKFLLLSVELEGQKNFLTFSKKLLTSLNDATWTQFCNILQNKIGKSLLEICNEELADV